MFQRACATTLEHEKYQKRHSNVLTWRVHFDQVQEVIVPAAIVNSK